MQHDTVFTTGANSHAENGSRDTSAHWRRLGASFLGGRGRRVSAKKFFYCPPPKCEIWRGRWRGTHCLLELNVGSVLSCRLLTLYILGWPYILPFNAWFVSIFGWARLNIEINHINIEPQVQIKAKSIIQFDNQHEFRIENGFRLT